MVPEKSGVLPLTWTTQTARMGPVPKKRKFQSLHNPGMNPWFLRLPGAGHVKPPNIMLPYKFLQ